MEKGEEEGKGGEREKRGMRRDGDKGGRKETKDERMRRRMKERKMSGIRGVRTSTCGQEEEVYLRGSEG